MALDINIKDVKINNISNNASLCVGPSYHYRHSADIAAQGVNISVGDFSPAESYHHNHSFSTTENIQDDKAQPFPKEG